jgi:8-oxoguanine deaminase
VVDVSEHVLLPGLVNTHHHFFQTLTRAHPAGLNKKLFDWLAALYPVWDRIDVAAFQAACAVANAELLLAGCTTTSDHHYLYPRGLDEAVDIQVVEARRAGIRTVITVAR